MQFVVDAQTVNCRISTGSHRISGIHCHSLFIVALPPEAGSGSILTPLASRYPALASDAVSARDGIAARGSSSSAFPGAQPGGDIDQLIDSRVGALHIAPADMRVLHRDRGEQRVNPEQCLVAMLVVGDGNDHPFRPG